tara:strand:+ start:487 stop:975 length:489 start_codon:yes stop_codon:yes gene_type:complete
MTDSYDPTAYDPTYDSTISGIGTTSTDPSHDPVTGAYIKPEDRVSVGTSANDYPAGGVPPETYGVPAQPIPGEGTYVDPGMYVENDGTTGPMAQPPGDPYAAAVDYAVAGMGTGVYNVDIPTHDHSEILQKLDELNAKVDHLLEHMHQPMTGTLQIDCPPKT